MPEKAAEGRTGEKPESGSGGAYGPYRWNAASFAAYRGADGVTSAIDGRPGSLRATISPQRLGDVIGFSSQLKGARLPLTLGELVIDKSLAINGSGQTLDAGGNFARDRNRRSKHDSDV